MRKPTPPGSSRTPIRTAGLYFPVLNARGGAERLTLVLALELAKAGVRTTIFTARSAPVDEIENDLGESIASLDIQRLPEPKHSPRLRAVRQATIDHVEAAAIRVQKLDLFINCDYRSSLPGTGRVNVFYCHFPHDLSVGDSNIIRSTYVRAIETAKRALVDRDLRGALATYERIWANSRFTAHHVGELWGRSAEIVYPPCDMLIPLDKERLIVAVGRFQSGRGSAVPHKSQEYLVDAFRDLTDLHAQGWRLALLGGAAEEDRSFVASLRAQSAGLPVDIRVNPSRAELAAVVGSASLFWHAQGVDGDATAHPHSQEHFGISTVEAMSAGALPVVYGAAGPAEIIEPVAGLSPWQDLDQLQEMTRSLAMLPAEQRDALADSCIHRAHDFDRSHFAQRLLSLLELETEAVTHAAAEDGAQS